MERSGIQDNPTLGELPARPHSRRQSDRGVLIRPDQRGEYNLWQRRFWEHLIRDEADFVRHVDYIHYNPVKHGLVDTPIEWR